MLAQLAYCVASYLAVEEQQLLHAALSLSITTVMLQPRVQFIGAIEADTNNMHDWFRLVDAHTDIRASRTGPAQR